MGVDLRNHLFAPDLSPGWGGPRGGRMERGGGRVLHVPLEGDVRAPAAGGACGGGRFRGGRGLLMRTWASNGSKVIPRRARPGLAGRLGKTLEPLLA